MYLGGRLLRYALAQFIVPDALKEHRRVEHEYLLDQLWEEALHFEHELLVDEKHLLVGHIFELAALHVNDHLEKIILDADVLASLMFGMNTGMKFASRLKHEIRFDDKADILFRGFLKLLDSKSLYLDSSKKSC